MLRNKSKQMGSMAKVVWHDGKGGGTVALKYIVQFNHRGARAMSCNRRRKRANLSAHLENRFTFLGPFAW